MYGTSKKFCLVGLSNPLFVDIPAIQIASNSLFRDKDKPDFGPSNLLSLDKKWPELPRACCKDDGYSDAKSELLWLWPLSLRGKCIIHSIWKHCYMMFWLGTFGCNPTAGVGVGCGVGGISKHPNTVIAYHMPGFISHVVLQMAL